MKYLIVFVIVLFFSCSGSRNLLGNTSTSSLDTSIAINNKYTLLIARKQENGKVFYTNPRIHSRGNNIKLNIFLNTSDIKNLTTFISPNSQFMVMCYVADNGYVHLSDSDSVYHEVFKCSMLSLKTGKTLKEELTPNESGGIWNKKNKWVDQNGKVLIDPLKL